MIKVDEYQGYDIYFDTVGKDFVVKSGEDEMARADTAREAATKASKLKAQAKSAKFPIPIIVQRSNSLVKARITSADLDDGSFWVSIPEVVENNEVVVRGDRFKSRVYDFRDTTLWLDTPANQEIMAKHNALLEEVRQLNKQCFQLRQSMNDGMNHGVLKSLVTKANKVKEVRS